MKIGIPKEQDDPRIALVPSVIEKIRKQLGVEVWVERDAGQKAYVTNEALEAAGAKVTTREEVLQCDLIISYHPLPDEEMERLPKSTWLISMFKPYFDKTITGKLRKLGLKAFSMDMIPRTTRAQAMDVLSSMASLAGYQATLLAATHLPRYFPMMITAAGSIKPATVVVLGAGVAGLQAIATARRLGAVVEAFDTRSAAKEEVLSLGAKFIEVEGAKEDTSAGGYAVEQDEDFLRRQREEVQRRAAKADVLITTAQVRGRKAPLLVPKETVEKMRPGSVIVDLAASTGGNCELTQDKKTIVHNGVTIIGDSELAAQKPMDASILFANNVFNFLKLIIKDGQLHLDLEDDIVASALFVKEEEETAQG